MLISSMFLMMLVSAQWNVRSKLRSLSEWQLLCLLIHICLKLNQSLVLVPTSCLAFPSSLELTYHSMRKGRKPENGWMSKHFQFEAVSFFDSGSNADVRVPSEAFSTWEVRCCISLQFPIRCNIRSC